MATRRDMQTMATPVETDNTALMNASDGSTTLQTDRGKVVIANGVVAKIAGLAAREIEGVHDLVSTSLGQTMAGFNGQVPSNALCSGNPLDGLFEC